MTFKEMDTISFGFSIYHTQDPSLHIRRSLINVPALPGLYKVALAMVAELEEGFQLRL